VGLVVFAMVPVQAHHGDDFRSLKRRIARLEKETQLLNGQGFYRGPIAGNQVLSQCAAGATAVWEVSPFEGLTMIDDCFTSQQQRSAARAVHP